MGDLNRYGLKVKVLKKIVKSNYFLLKGFIYLLAIKELFGKKSIKQYFQNNNNQLIFYCSSYSHFDTVKSLLIKCEKSKYDVCLITSFELNKELKDKVKAIAKQENTNLYRFLLTAFNVIRYKKS